MNTFVHSSIFPNNLLDPLVANNKESSTLEAARIARQRVANGQPVYNWGLGTNPFHIPNVLVNAVKEHAHLAPYTSVEGIPGLSEAIAKEYSTENYQVAENGVIIAPGLKQILFDAQRAFGGEIIHVVPYWVSYTEQTRLMGKSTIEIHTKEENQYKVTPEDLEAVCQANPELPKMIILNNPCNPTGQVYSNSELKALAAIINKYPIYVLADEVYHGNLHSGKHHSIADYVPNRTIRTSSLSKEFAAGGYRLGWATFPEELMELKKAMSSIGSSTYSCAAVPVQHAALAAFKDTSVFTERKEKEAYILRHLGKRAAKGFRELGVNCMNSEAAWYLLLDFTPHQKVLNKRGIHTSSELTKALIEEVGVVFVPGEAFGIPSSKLMVRASFVDFKGTEALDACEGRNLSDEPDNQFFSPWASRIDESITVIEGWLAQAATPL